MVLRHRYWMLVGLMTLVLGACGTEQTPSRRQSPTTVNTTAQPSPTAQESADTPTTLCDLATLDEVQAVTGGTIQNVIVGNLDNLQYSDCTYMDPQDFSKSLRMVFTTSEKMAKTGSPLQNAAAYFAENTKNGEPVAGLGEQAAWVEGAGYGLYVLKGDTVIEFGAPSRDPAVRAKFETLAHQVVSRLP